ncbi:ATP-grasp domain-containing protein [Spongiactinospora sp. TRM90649]|uniref:ATP-grasp domain-containing protein n=1 Tax=Spongiactinospora sp. TRM90649 TaxID=3031114 RepID=UPI0023FA05A1|nr:ATP-grasp domain-containing protein [Spongiactinospora sp. TRM90649]MDF5756211.1 ATP-grasp domain-containing protein [Spongiactinospora sp. TRM90649]
MRVLIVGTGVRREFGLRSLRDAGHVVGIVDLLHRIPVEWCDRYSAANPRDTLEVVKAIETMDIPWDAVLCWEDSALDSAHAAAGRLGLPRPLMDSVCFRDKAAMHRRLRAASVPSAQLGDASDLAECVRLVRAAGFPAVVKPADGSGSSGVQIVREPGEVAAAFRAAAPRGHSGRVVVDRYLDGPEFSVESVSWGAGEHEIVGITEKTCTSPPYCVELAHYFPAEVPDDLAARIGQVVTDALTALGMRAGVSHAEVRVVDGTPYVIEVAGRPAGDFIPKLVRLATGRDLHLLELAAVTGTRAPEGEPSCQAAAVAFFQGEPDAVIARPDVHAVLADPVLGGAAIELAYWWRDGARAPMVRSSGDRLGHCVLAGRAEQVRQALSLVGRLEPVGA